MLRKLGYASIKSAATVLSSSSGNNRLWTLMYHRVLSNNDAFLKGTVNAKQFEEQVRFLSSNFNILSLSEAIQKLKSGELPPRAVCITFDDGYADNYEVALPILKRSGVVATFFIATGFLDGGCMWNDAIIEALRRTQERELNLQSIGVGNYSILSEKDRSSASQALIQHLKYRNIDERENAINQILECANITLPKNLMMSTGQVKALFKEGMEVGAHTVNHPILTSIDSLEVKRELLENKLQLEGIIGEKVNVFAYPNGFPNKDYTKDHVELVKTAGFLGAVSTAWGVAEKNTDEFQLPRFTPWDRNVFRFGIRALKNYLRKDVLTA